MQIQIYKELGTGIFAAFLIASTSLVALSEATAKPLSCKSVYMNKYLSKPLHKAMATSGGRPPSSSMEMSCGWAFGYLTKQQAMKLALGDCRRADRNFKNRRDCKIIYAE
jgi:hypothetical protein